VRYDLSPDGDRIAIADFAGVWVTRRDGSHARPILDDAGQQEGAAEIAWSPNGRELVFARSDAVLFTISAEGKNLRQVTSDADQPDWTPDGKKIVFVRHPDRTGSWAGLVSVIGADGRGLRRIVDRGTWNKPRVSPDGATVAFDDGEDIYVAPMKGGNPRLFIRNGYNPVWSPDGRFLAFARPVHVPPEPNADDGVETSRVFIMRVSGGTARAYGPKIGDMCCLSWSR
jgi:Tol biopolymer transport system component